MFFSCKIFMGVSVLTSVLRYPISRCDTYRDTWVTMRYVSRYLSIGLISAYICNLSIMAIECQ